MKKVVKKIDYFILFLLIFLTKILMIRYFLYKDFDILRLLLTEISPVILVMVLIEFIIRKGRLWAYLFLNLVLSTFLFSVVIYFSYFSTLPSYYDLTQLDQVGSVSESIFLLVRPIHFLFFADFLLIPFLIWKNKLVSQQRAFNKVGLTILLALSLVVSGVNLFLGKDDDIIDPTSIAQGRGMLHYQILEIYQGLNQKQVDTHFTTEDILEVKGAKRINPTEFEYFGAAKDRNLILIQVESMQDFLLNLEIDGVEITPNLNALLTDSFHFSNVFQQIGAGNTSDAEFLVNTSLYPLGKQAVSKTLVDKKFPSLPRVLKDNGYVTTTFHADEITYWNRNTLYPSLGFDKFYDDHYFGEEDIVGFGSSDEVLFTGTLKALMEMQDKNQRFYAHVLTLTSHTPFEIPEEKIGIDLPKEFDGTLVGNYLKSMNYTDRALGEFIKGLKQSGLWENSIIALYGDHSGLHGKLMMSKDTKLMKERVLGHGYSLVDRFNIPFVLTIPGVTHGEEITRIGGQIDIMPTLANVLGVSLEDQKIFGQDLLNYDTNLLGMRYYLPTGSYIDDDVLFVPKTRQRNARTYNLITKQITDAKDDYVDKYNAMLQLYEWSDAYLHGLPSK
ncbi:LTA synthase family protein [Bacillus timonensis]|uniref:LTA synthase family protein n=1 Tax=Bacillus timonensis TaxID=1033734 RepID=UPI0002DF17D7|nr:LTA synthase family protein [Bacillus timonensis]